MRGEYFAELLVLGVSGLERLVDDDFDAEFVALLLLFVLLLHGEADEKRMLGVGLLVHLGDSFKDVFLELVTAELEY